MYSLRESKSIHSGKGKRWLLLEKCHNTCDIHLGRRQRSSGGFCYRKPFLVILPPPCCSASRLSCPDTMVAHHSASNSRDLGSVCFKISSAYKSVIKEKKGEAAAFSLPTPATAAYSPMQAHQKTLNQGPEVHSEEQRSPRWQKAKLNKYMNFQTNVVQAREFKWATSAFKDKLKTLRQHNTKRIRQHNIKQESLSILRTASLFWDQCNCWCPCSNISCSTFSDYILVFI